MLHDCTTTKDFSHARYPGGPLLRNNSSLSLPIRGAGTYCTAMVQRTWVFLGIACLLIASLAGVCSAAEEPKDRVITATGSGEVLVAPDQAIVTLGVLTENADVKVAQADNAQKMSSVVTAIEKTGIDKADIRTTGYTVDLVYEDGISSFARKVRLYRVTNMVRVTVRDVQRAGVVVDAGIAAGANQVNSVTLTLSETAMQAARTQALQKAVGSSRQEAQTVATSLGVNITGVRDASISGYYPVPVRYEGGYAAAAKDMAATPIEPGTLSVSASVTVNYFIQ